MVGSLLGRLVSFLVTLSLLCLAHGVVLFLLRLSRGMVLLWLRSVCLSSFLPWSWPDIWSYMSCRRVVVHSLPLVEPGWYCYWCIAGITICYYPTTTPMHCPGCYSYGLMVVAHWGTLPICSALNITPTFCRSSTGSGLGFFRVITNAERGGDDDNDTTTIVFMIMMLNFAIMLIITMWILPVFPPC